MSLASVLRSVFFAWRVDILIRIANFNVNFDDAREWYNGYSFAGF